MDFNDFVFRDHAAENLGASLEPEGLEEDGDTTRETVGTVARRAVGRALVGSLGLALLSSMGRMKH